MGQTFETQPLITLMGKYDGIKIRNVVQPVYNWGDAKDHKDATFHVQILRLDGMPVPTSIRFPRLLIQTAASPAGPWGELAQFGGSAPTLPINEIVGASTGAPEFAGTFTSYLERFFRWKLDVSDLDEIDDEWAICFGIWVTLK